MLFPVVLQGDRFGVETIAVKESFRGFALRPLREGDVIDGLPVPIVHLEGGPLFRMTLLLCPYSSGL